MKLIRYQDTGHFKDCVKTKKKQSPRSAIQTSLNQEVHNKISQDTLFQKLHFRPKPTQWFFKYSVHSPSVQILQLEKKLQDQVIVRCALEKALGDGSSSHDFPNEASLPKVASCSLHQMEKYMCSFIHPGP